MKKVFSDEEIIKGIKKGGKQLEAILRWLYQESGCKERIINLLGNQNATKFDAEDIFQEGLSQLVIQVKKGVFRKEAKIETYLTSICKRIWYKKLKRVKTFAKILTTLPDEAKVDYSTPELFLLKEEQENRLSLLLANLGKQCQKIIGLWSLGYSIKEIVARTPYKNENVVSKKKYECTKKLTALLVQKPNLVEDILRNKSF